MALNYNALIDEEYFTTMWDGENDFNVDRLHNLINSVSTAFEKFCNRYLKERTFVSDEDDIDEDEGIFFIPEYSIFDAPKGNTFWFPTYPVKEIDSFLISGTEIALSTDYTATEGYILYKSKGKLVYNYGFGYPYMNNVVVDWTGGYANDSIEMAHLKYLCFLVVKDTINAPQNMTYQSEKIGNYSYKTMPTYFLKALQGLSPIVFSDLYKYRKEAIG